MTEVERKEEKNGRDRNRSERINAILRVTVVLVLGFVIAAYMLYNVFLRLESLIDIEAAIRWLL